MRFNRRLRKQVAILGGIKYLTLDLDFTALDDGALPDVFSASTFAIASGEATNTPTLGSELLTNPGLEGTYVSGLAPNLTKVGSPTVSESVDVHGGSSAQSVTMLLTTNQLRWPSVTGVSGAWYRFSVWAKSVSASGVYAFLYQADGLPDTGGSQLIDGSAYQQETLSFVSRSTNVIFAYPARGGSGNAIVDDGSLKQITYADLFALADVKGRLLGVKAKPAPVVDGSVSGVVAWADSETSPDTYLLGYWRLRPAKTYVDIGLIKCVAGVYSQMISTTPASYVSGAWLEIRPVTNTSVDLYYNNVQIGTTQTVADVPGSCAGFLVSGGNNLEAFFVG